MQTTWNIFYEYRPLNNLNKLVINNNGQWTLLKYKLLCTHLCQFEPKFYIFMPMSSVCNQWHFASLTCFPTGEKQAATHVSLDQEFDRDLSQMWRELEERVVAVANRGTVPVTFQPSQCCLNSQTDNLRYPLAVVEGTFPPSTCLLSSFICAVYLVFQILIPPFLWLLHWHKLLVSVEVLMHLRVFINQGTEINYLPFAFLLIAWNL